MKKDLVAVSGGFDPAHSGHIDYIEGASKYGDVIVFLNSDEWLFRKKGYVFMKWEERARVLGYMKGVVDVVRIDDKDGTVVDGLQRYLPKYFANGGDRGPDNTPEVEWCGHLGIEMLYNIGGGKTQSSSELIRGVSEILLHR